MKNKYKILVAVSSIVILVLLISGGFYITSKEKFINNFEILISEKNITELQKNIISSEKNLTVKKADIHSFLNYFENDKDKKNRFLETLNEQLDASSESYQNHSFFKIVSNKRQFLIFPKYQLELQPQYLTISTDADKIILRDSEKKLINYDTRSKKYGPIFPGKHEFKMDLVSDIPMVEITKKDVIIWDKDKNLEAYLTKELPKEKSFTENVAKQLDLFSNEYAAFIGGGFVDADSPVLKELAAELIGVRSIFKTIDYQYNGIKVNNDAIKLFTKGSKWHLEAELFLDTETSFESVALEGFKMEIEKSSVYKYELIYDKKMNQWEVVSREEGFGKSDEWKNVTEIHHKQPKKYNWNSDETIDKTNLL